MAPFSSLCFDLACFAHIRHVNTYFNIINTDSIFDSSCFFACFACSKLSLSIHKSILSLFFLFLFLSFSVSLSFYKLTHSLSLSHSLAHSLPLSHDAAPVCKLMHEAWASSGPFCNFFYKCPCLDICFNCLVYLV